MLSWNVRKNLRFHYSQMKTSFLKGYGQLTSMLHNRNHGFLTERILKSEVVSKFLRQLSNWEFLPWESGEFYRVTGMLVAYELKKNRCVPSLKYDWKAALPVVYSCPKMHYLSQNFVLCGWPSPLFQNYLGVFRKLLINKIKKIITTNYLLSC